jgi:phosphoribosylformylglycinamidine synthase
MIIDGEEKQSTLFSMVKSTQKENVNSIIAFHDNSSSIRGFEVDVLQPSNPLHASSMILNKVLLHQYLLLRLIIFPVGLPLSPVRRRALEEDFVMCKQQVEGPILLRGSPRIALAI